MSHEDLFMEELFCANLTERRLKSYFKARLLVKFFSEFVVFLGVSF